MRKYEGQASHYKQDGEELKAILDKVITTTDEVQGLLDQTYKDAKNDFFTNKINENNETVVQDVDEIKSKIDSISGSLSSEATRLDDEDEREEAERLKAVAKK